MTADTGPAANLRKMLLLLAAAMIALASPAAFAQGDAAPQSDKPAPSARTLAFDVATIKPNPSNEPQGGWMGVKNSPDGIEAAFVTLPMLVQRAYGLRTDDQVSGAPEWAKTDRFDIQAKMGDAEIAEMQKMSPADSNARRELLL